MGCWNPVTILAAASLAVACGPLDQGANTANNTVNPGSTPPTSPDLQQLKNQVHDEFSDCLISLVGYGDVAMTNAKEQCWPEAIATCRTKASAALRPQCDAVTLEATAWLRTCGDAIECDSGYCTVIGKHN